MSRSHIVFAHGNSFPGGTYSALHHIWREAGWQVHVLDRFGHEGDRPMQRISSNWPQLERQLHQFILTHCDAPAVLVGHSLGGALSLMVGCQHPELVRAVVMLDSPVISGWRARTLQLAKLTGVVGRVSPGKVAKQRKYQWPNRQAAYAHFQSKRLFQAWEPAVLADYLTHGLQALSPQGDQGPVRLSFDRDIETAIYNTLPHHMDQILRRHPPGFPVGFVAGEESAEMRQAGLARSREVAGPYFDTLPGGHLFPMERPEATARKVLELLARMGHDAHHLQAEPAEQTSPA